jgi:ATP-dependent Clp protease adaptor protein ClpS
VSDTPVDSLETCRVLLLNDDKTPMEFVVYVLERLFGKPREDATRLMLYIHEHGSGVCGVFPRDAAEAKAAEVSELARAHQHPLQCVVEED